FSAFCGFEIENSGSRKLFSIYSMPLWSKFPRRLHAKLEQIGATLDALPGTTLQAVEADIDGVGDDAERHDGMSAPQVLRAMVIQQVTGMSYDELAFHLQDSSMFRGFCRIGAGQSFSPALLQKSIHRITPRTWECVRCHLAAFGL